MRRRIALAELPRLDVAVQTTEALAIVRQLIQTTGSNSSISPPSSPGLLSPENVYVEADGSVSCSACDATPAVSELASVLQYLLAGATAVPGSLRYTLARALLEVDAPPFDSIDQFSAALVRHERGDAQAVVRALFERVAGADAVARPALERRRAAPSVADLRRQLREADLRVYDQQLALDAMLQMTGKARPHVPSRAAIVVGAAALLVLIGAGDRWQVLRPATHAQAAVPELPPMMPGSDKPDAERPASAEIAPSAAEKHAPAESTAKHAPQRTAKPDRSGAAHVRRAPSPRLLDRLHLRWLRGKVVVRSDAL